MRIASGTLAPDVVRRLARTIPWAVAVVCTALTLIVLYPGQYPYDSANQLWQARTGHFGNGSPVAMIALWSVLLALTDNPAALFCLNLAMYWTGIALCAVCMAQRAWVRAVLVVLLGSSPLALVQMTHVLTDAHLCAVMVLASGLAALGLSRQRRAPLVACAAILVYAGCVRHNAVLAVMPFGAVLALASSQNKRGWSVGLKGVAGLALATVLLGFVLDRSLVQRRISVWPTLALWDLAAISVDSGVLLLPPFTHGPGMTVAELVQTGAFDPTINVPLFERSKSGMRDGYDTPYTREEKRALFVAWLDAAYSNFGAYLRHRLRTFALLTGRHGGGVQGVAYLVVRSQYLDNPPLPHAVAPLSQAMFYRTASSLQSGWLFAGLPYLLTAAVSLVVGWKKRDRPAARAAIAVSSSALLYAVSFVPLAPAADLRYLTWPIAAAFLALAFALSSLKLR